MSEHAGALIIGAGKMGAFFDSPESKNVLSHAHALYESPNFCIKGFMDTDYESAVKAADIWGGKSYKSVSELENADGIDVIIISTPDNFHYKNLKEILSLNPKLVVLEKPITKNMTEAKEVIGLYKGKAVLVNYSRRYLNEYASIKSAIEDGKFGKFLSGTAYYGKGIVHNGSHMINMIVNLLGNFSSYAVNKKLYDFYNDDPSVGCILKYPSGADMHLIPIDCGSVTIFEFDMMFEKKRLSLINSGLDIVMYDNSPSPFYDGYSNYVYVETVSIDFSQALINLYKDAYRYLESGDMSGCCLAEAYETMKICNELRDAGE